MSIPVVIQYTVIIPIGVVLWCAVGYSVYNFFSAIMNNRRVEKFRMERHELISEAARIMYENMVMYGEKVAADMGFGDKPGHYIDSDHWAFKQWLDVLYNRPFIKKLRNQ